MTTSTPIDTNILIDLLSGGPFFEASASSVMREVEAGELVISPVVWAELAFTGIAEDMLSRQVAWLRPRREALPFAAAFPAGLAHALYRRRGGRRERTLPDFLIGAHALVGGHRLLTRDVSRYRGYFLDLEIISPETHP